MYKRVRVQSSVCAHRQVSREYGRTEGGREEGEKDGWSEKTRHVHLYVSGEGLMHGIHAFSLQCVCVQTDMHVHVQCTLACGWRHLLPEMVMGDSGSSEGVEVRGEGTPLHTNSPAQVGTFVK